VFHRSESYIVQLGDAALAITGVHAVGQLSGIASPSIIN